MLFLGVVGGGRGRWAQTEVWVRRKGKWVSGVCVCGGGVERMASGGGSVPQSVCPELPPPGSPASGAKSGSANTQLGKADQLHLIRDLRVVAAGCLHGGREDGVGVSADKKAFRGTDRPLEHLHILAQVGKETHSFTRRPPLELLDLFWSHGATALRQTGL